MKKLTPFFVLLFLFLFGLFGIVAYVYLADRYCPLEEASTSKSLAWHVKFFCEAKAADAALVFFTYGLMIVTAWLDAKFAGDVRPEFIQTVKQLQPIDASILKEIVLRHMEPSSRVFGSNHIYEALKGYRPSAIEVSLEHLHKLGCLGSHSQGMVMSNFGMEFMTACDPHSAGCSR